MSDAAASIPGGSPEELQRQYFGRGDSSRGRRRHRRLAPLSAFRRGGARESGSCELGGRAVEESEIVIQAVEQPDGGRAGPRAHERRGAVRVLEPSASTWAQRVAAVEVATAAMASAAYRSVEVFLERHMNVVGSGSGRAGTHHHRRRRPPVAHRAGPRRHHINASAATTRSSVSWRSTTGTTTRAGLRGHRARAPTWCSTSSRPSAAPARPASSPDRPGTRFPSLAWLTIVTELESPDQRRAALQTRRRAALGSTSSSGSPSTSKWRWTRFVTGQMMDVRRRFLRREAADAAELLHRREETKAALLILGGRGPSRQHRVRNPPPRARRSSRAPRTSRCCPWARCGSWSCVARDRRHETIALRRRRNLRRRPRRSRCRWCGPASHPRLSAADIAGERFEGWSASPGRYEGIARESSIHPASSASFDGARCSSRPRPMPPGPRCSWPPVRSSSSRAARLSHAAIVARELGHAGGRERARPDRPAAPGRTRHADGDGRRHRRRRRDPRLRWRATTASIPMRPSTSRDAQAGTRCRRGRHGAGPPDPTSDGRTPARDLNVFVAGLMGAGALDVDPRGLSPSRSARTRGQGAPSSPGCTQVALMMSEGTIHGYEHVLSAPDRPCVKRREYLLACDRVCSVWPQSFSPPPSIPTSPRRPARSSHSHSPPPACRNARSEAARPHSPPPAHPMARRAPNRSPPRSRPTGAGALGVGLREPTRPDKRST